MLKKICSKCKKELPATNEYFSNDSKAKDGLRHKCKECTKKYNKQYRESNKNFSIYMITCIENGKVYIGQTTVKVSERISHHFSDARNGSLLPLHVEMKNNGLNKKYFKYEILEVAKNKHELDLLEMKWIKHYRTNGYKLYNLDSGGNFGKYHSESTKSKMRGSGNGRAILNEDSVLKVIQMLISKTPLSEIAEKFGIDKTTVSSINNKRIWKQVTVKGYENVKRYSDNK